MRCCEVAAPGPFPPAEAARPARTVRAGIVAIYGGGPRSFFCARFPSPREPAADLRPSLPALHQLAAVRVVRVRSGVVGRLAGRGCPVLASDHRMGQEGGPGGFLTYSLRSLDGEGDAEAMGATVDADSVYGELSFSDVTSQIVPSGAYRRFQYSLNPRLENCYEPTPEDLAAQETIVIFNIDQVSHAGFASSSDGSGRAESDEGGSGRAYGSVRFPDPRARYLRSRMGGQFLNDAGAGADHVLMACISARLHRRCSWALTQVGWA